MTLWYLARAAGVMALIFFTVAASLGALGSSTRTPERRFWLQYVHRSAAVTGLLLLLAHVVAVISDSNVNISASVIVWPFGSGYRPLAMARRSTGPLRTGDCSGRRSGQGTAGPFGGVHQVLALDPRRRIRRLAPVDRPQSAGRYRPRHALDARDHSRLPGSRRRRRRDTPSEQDRTRLVRAS